MVIQEVDPPLTPQERIWLLRCVAGLTQMELAIRLGTDKTYVCRLESPTPRAIRSDTLIKLVRVFGVSADYLVGLTQTLPLADPATQARYQLALQAALDRRLASQAAGRKASG